MTREISFPKTRFDDYVNWRKVLRVNSMGFRKNGMSEDEIKENIDFLYNRFFQDKLFEDDMYFFNSLNNLESFLLESKYFPVKEIDECIKHEKEHLEKIDEFGYSVKGFYVCLLKDDNDVKFAAGISMNEKEIPLDKFREIALAPSKPSLTDKFGF